MRAITCFCLFFVQFICLSSPAQEILLDTFIRKDGIHTVPAFEPWETATLFRGKSAKGKQAGNQPLLPLEACERVKYYSSAAVSGKKTEPHRFFKVLADLEAHDSTNYFQVLSDMPPPYRSFFSGLYHVEYNRFNTAVSFFDSALAAGDSLLLKETPFWKDAAMKMLNEQSQHNTIYTAYTLLEHPRVDSGALMKLLQQVSLPQYLMHKYICLYNYSFRKNDYGGARLVYDSIVSHASYSKMKASLAKNRNAALAILAAKENFIATVKKGLYHYEIDYLYDNLETWGRDTLTDKEFVTDAGFLLHQGATKSDSIYTRWLLDTAAIDALSKFEVLSFVRTPLDRAGRRFVIVKLGFDNEDTYNKYVAFLAKFKSKPVQQSVLYNKGGISEGNEYMLTKHFIAALYRQDDPVIKYELSLYLIQDAEGNVYAVDTLF
jgi:hypothetical protein